MFDLGWAEMAVIALLAVIVIGPKELPLVLRTLGKWIGKARAMAREFQDSMEEIARETELADIKKQIETIGNTDLEKAVENAIDPAGEISEGLDMSEFTMDDAPESGEEEEEEKEEAAEDDPAPDAPSRAETGS